MKKMFKQIVVAIFVVAIPAISFAVPATFISPSQITSTPFSITSPGLYVLTDDVAYNTSGGTAITINSSDVILDLSGKAIVNSGAGVENAISLASTFTNITIRNGALRIFDGTGIIVPTGSAHIVVEDVNIVGVNTTVGIGFDLQGTAGATTRTTDVMIKNCNVTSCLRGLNATAVDAATIQNSTFNRNGNRSILITDCNEWNLDYCQASLNRSATEGFGVIVISGSFWTIKNSDFSSNAGGTSAASGFTFQTGSFSNGGHIIENCMFCNNSSNSATVIGLDLQSTNSCIIKNCVISGNFSNTGGSQGMRISGTGVVIENCKINGNLSSGSTVIGLNLSPTATGFYIVDCDFTSNTCFGASQAIGVNVIGFNHLFDRCAFSSNAALGGSTAQGMLIQATARGCIVKNSIAISNTHDGFRSNAPSGTNLFIGNMSFGHGVAGVSNYSGVGAAPFLSVAATGPYPLAGSFDNRHLANLSFT